MVVFVPSFTIYLQHYSSFQLVTSLKQGELQGTSSSADEGKDDDTEQQPGCQPKAPVMSQTIMKSAFGQSTKALLARKADDLYSAHDFDIQIEVNVPAKG